MTCPHCGYCSHCGRGGYFQPYRNPYWNSPFTNAGQYGTTNQPISLGGQHSIINQQTGQKTCNH